ncbi:hypothetical protein, partial [Methylomonas sp. MgM2]
TARRYGFQGLLNLHSLALRFQGFAAYDKIVKNIYMHEWDHELVFQAIMSEYVPSNASGYLIAKTFRIPRSRADAFKVTQGVCSTTGKKINFQTVMTWSVMTNNMVLPIGYRLLDPKLSAPDLFDQSEVCNLKSRIDERRITVYTDSDLGINKSFLDYLESKNVGLSYIVELTGDFKVVLSGPITAGVNNLKPKPTAVSELAKVLLLDDAKFIDTSRKSFQEKAWQVGDDRQSSYFALKKVRILTERYQHNKVTLSNEKYLLIEWPLKEDTPTGYWLTNITINSRGTSSTTLGSLVDRIKKCTKNENVFDRLKTDYFLYGYHAKEYSTFYHHAALCIIAYVLAIN